MCTKFHLTSLRSTNLPYTACNRAMSSWDSSGLGSFFEYLYMMELKLGTCLKPKLWPISCNAIGFNNLIGLLTKTRNRLTSIQSSMSCGGKILQNFRNSNFI